MAESTNFFTLDSIIISSSSLNEDTDITGLVSDIAIYENIDLPFLTAELALVDDKRLLERLDLVGGEFVTISIKTQVEGEPVTKRFCIERVNETSKVNERAEAIMLTLVEDISFISNFKNVNLAYQGNPIEILDKISTNFLNKTTSLTHETPAFQKLMKLVVPNMHPIEAMMWIKNRITDEYGFPTYLYSTLHLDDLLISSLGDMIVQDPLNKRMPFLYGANASMASELFVDKGTFNPLPIESYTFSDKGQGFNLIHKGLVGATYQFYDALTARIYKHKFSYTDDVVSQFVDQERPHTSLDVSYDEVNVNAGNSRVLSRVASSGAYNIGTSSIKTLDEENSIANHKKRVTAYAMKNHMRDEGNITVRVKGQGFLSPGTNKTIGNVYRFLFYANRPAEENNLPIDRRKSGDYMIHSVKHVFAKERYDVHLTGYKLQHFKEDQIPIE